LHRDPFFIFLLFFFVLLVLQPLDVVRVILRLQFLDLSGLLASFFNLFEGSLLFGLKHANSVAKLFYVMLDLETDRASLAVRQLIAFNVYHDVL
jgi:hypothetical protein